MVMVIEMEQPANRMLFEAFFLTKNDNADNEEDLQTALRLLVERDIDDAWACIRELASLIATGAKLGGFEISIETYENDDAIATALVKSTAAIIDCDRPRFEAQISILRDGGISMRAFLTAVWHIALHQLVVVLAALRDIRPGILPDYIKDNLNAPCPIRPDLN